MKSIGNICFRNRGVKRCINFHKERNCCCCCINAKVGTIFIGLSLLVALVFEHSDPNYVRLMLKVASIVPFIMMLVKDVEAHRKLFFLMFCITMPLIAIVNLVCHHNILDNVSIIGTLCWLSKKWVAQYGGTEEDNEA